MMFVHLRHTCNKLCTERATKIALFATLLLGIVLPAQAQQSSSPQRARMQAPPTGGNMVPLRRSPMTGNSTFLPSDIAVRSTVGVKGFDKKPSRVRIGGASGASVTEKVVNLTQSEPSLPTSTTDFAIIDERTPIWTVDERFLYLLAIRAATRPATTLPASQPTNRPIPAPTHRPLSAIGKYRLRLLLPGNQPSQTRVAFIRSGDGKDIDAADKKWDLYVADMPANGQFVDEVELGATNLPPLDRGTRFPGRQGRRVAFTNVGRPAWAGGTDVVFAGQLAGDTNYHIFSVNIQTRVIFQLTAGAADERNPQVSPDGRLYSLRFQRDNQHHRRNLPFLAR